MSKKILITISLLIISLNCIGCGFIKEKFFSKKDTGQIYQEKGDESEESEPEQKQKLKGPIPINPSHS